MANIIIFFSFVTALLFQTTIIARINLLHGAADLVMLVLVAFAMQKGGDETDWTWGIAAGILVGFASQVPIFVALAGYLGVVLFIHQLQSRMWQAPMLILFASVIAGSFIINGLELLYLLVIGTSVSIPSAFNLVLLPSLILNLLFILPVYAVVGELTKQLYPQGIEI